VTHVKPIPQEVERGELIPAPNDLYGLDLVYSMSEINKRLERAPKFKRQPIKLEEYPIENAHKNTITFIMNELMKERQNVYKFYYN
jgi:hypothetical protein